LIGVIDLVGSGAVCVADDLPGPRATCFVFDRGDVVIVEWAVRPEGVAAVGTDGAVGPIRVLFLARASTTEGRGILPDPESLCRDGR
jgi:hypothetical protein